MTTWIVIAWLGPITASRKGGAKPGEVTSPPQDYKLSQTSLY